MLSLGSRDSIKASIFFRIRCQNIKTPEALKAASLFFFLFQIYPNDVFSHHRIFLRSSFCFSSVSPSDVLALPIFKQEDTSLTSDSETKNPPFQYVLCAATSPAVKLHDETLTYLNQGESFCWQRPGEYQNI